MNLVEQEEYRDCIIKILYDDMPEDPREMWDNFGHMVCFHRRYSLGDKHDFSVDEIKDFVNRKDVISLPLYLYDHSGITMNTSGFSCPWDSGQVGYIYVTKDEIKREYNVKKVTKKLLKKVYDLLRAEVETYDNFITGSVYGYEAYTNEEEDFFIDSCWGFYGYDQRDYAKSLAKSSIDAFIEEMEKRNFVKENVTSA